MPHSGDGPSADGDPQRRKAPGEAEIPDCLASPCCLVTGPQGGWRASGWGPCYEGDRERQAPPERTQGVKVSGMADHARQGNVVWTACGHDVDTAKCLHLGSISPSQRLVDAM